MVELPLWQAVTDALDQGQRCALLAVADHRGSSPGKTGALMAITLQGPLAGTIGGGGIESALMTQVMADLQADSFTPSWLTRRHRPEAEDSSGMICGGEQTVVTALLQPEHLADIRSLLAALTEGRRCGWQISARGWELDVGVTESGWLADADWCYRHVSGPRVTVYLVGGGHVSLALSALLRGLDFRVVVLEERGLVSSFLQNTQAHLKRVCGYEELGAEIPDGESVFSAIMTHSHERDFVALRALAGKRLGYLGVLGSRSKVRQLLEICPAPPFLHAPMGVPICSHSPEEIAVSVAAEMVGVRNAVVGS
ncbi:MAG: XdhC family protein [Fluviicoccus sp.]|uniref:XdhC family protein n=1 Tax=Fluviicoccus sp. TaxID=2003552 RepID=UPI002724BD0E|nr:XdhC/CoxI family protein [Fluviicoccus sp.]MDO8329436.1 XdhC family protein [Fluviicoccus sp.]